jgi:hypothetical protein
MATTSTPAINPSVVAIGTLTESNRMMAPSVATQGGSTFHTNMFSMVKMAFEVAVMRLVSMPGNRSWK